MPKPTCFPAATITWEEKKQRKSQAVEPVSARAPFHQPFSVSMTPISCNPNRGDCRRVDRHHLCRMLVVSLLACQVFFFTPCLQVLHFTILAPTQATSCSWSPVAPSHPSQEQVFLRTCLPPSFGGALGAPPQKTTTSAVGPIYTGADVVGPLSLYHGYLLLDKPFTATEQIFHLIKTYLC